MDNLKESRDNFNMISEYDDNCLCNYCKKELILNKDSWYRWGEHEIDLCVDCARNTQAHMDNGKLLNRKKFTVKKKPLLWPCVKCECKMGGGVEWYLFWDNIDMCKHCVNDKNTLCENILKKFEFVPDKNQMMITRMYLLIIDVSPTSDHTFVVPDEIKSDITAERNTTFIELFEELVFSDIKGSILKWTLISDFDHVDYFDACTGLIIKCEYPYQVASMCGDNHGRVALNVIYETYEDYLKDFNSWKKPDVETLEKISKKNEQSRYDDRDLTHEDCILGSKSFSEYIRLKKNLDMYYG